MTKHKDTIEQFVAKRPQMQPVPVELRFWEKVDKKGPDECWEWTGGRVSKGYGSVAGPNGTTLSAHRVAYELTFGPIPDGKKVLHECDNPPCCNPGHLFLGTDLTNRLDCVQKGRANSANGSAPKVRNLKLTADQIPKIREMHKGGLSLAAIGKVCGVHYTTIWGVIHGKTWTHV